MPGNPANHKLRQLLGRRVVYRGQRCQIIEILEAERSLVLRCDNDQRTIQGNQFGEANRRVQACFTLSLVDQDGNLDPLIRSWLD